MNYSSKKNKGFLVLLGLSIFAILGVAPYFLGPGLTQPVAVGTFLNGNFPDVTASALPYRAAFPNITFNSPLAFIDVPNSNKLVVGQRDGELYWFENDETITTKNLLVDLSDRVGVVWDGGFIGLAIHPEFGTPNKNYIYTYYTSKDQNGNDYPDAFLSGFGCYQEDYWGGFLYLRRYEINPTTFAIVPESEFTMLKIRMFSSTHRGGALEFGDDGFLYLSTGEQSAYTKPQNITTNLDGGVLRLDINQDPTKSHAPIRKLNTGRFVDEISGVGYGIPNDNPFLSPSGQNFEEYYTIGHRNPHRMTKDALTGIMYVGEVGESTNEEVNIISKGKNYGWPVYEGNGPGPGANCGGPDDGMYNNMPHEGPLVAFPRSEANALMGGYVYRGTDMPQYYGKYICADYGIGEEIWAVDINTGAYSLITAFSPTDIISFGEDNNGELYLLSQGNNVSLYKMTQVNESPAAPQLLSQTGAFQDLLTLTPNSGLLPYDLVESFWSDGAEKKRWMVIPNDGTHNTPQEKISFSEDGDWEFPVGSVLIKHFEMPIDDSNPSITKRLETRFSIKASSGNFYFLTYKWNDEQTDAVLLDSRLDENIEIMTTSGSSRYQTWTYPGTQDCIACHNPATKGTLGPRTRFLNSNITYPQTAINANQLVTLSHLGILDETIDDNTVLGYQTHKALDDTNASLDEKARSYLDNNCAYCHRPGGTGDRAQFDLRLSKTLVETGLMYAGTNSPIDGLEKIVIAGDASNSILFHRTESVDQTVAMPPIAKNVADQNGLDLIEAWINQLDPNYEDPTIRACTYIITNVGSGLVMDIDGVSQANGADVHQWQYVAGQNQQFIVAPAGNNYYTLKAVHSNKNIDVAAQGQAPGTNVIQYVENGTDAQLFSFEYLGNNQYAIKSKANELYLSIENNSMNNGGSIKTYVNNGSDFFKWTFTELAIPVTGVTVSEEFSIILTGENVALTASVLPVSACDQNVIWSSSDNTIATVDATGNVTGIAGGIATITATTVEGAFTDSAQITVISNDCNGTIVDHTDPVGSGTILARGEFNEVENRFKAFDNKKTENDFSKWLDNTGIPSENNPSFISIEFNSPQFVNKLVITSANDDYGRDPENFRILGSNGGNFTELGSWSGEQFSNRYQSKTFLFANVTAYKTYRLEITKNDDDIALTQLAEIELIGCDGPVEDITYTYDVNGWSPSDPNGVAYSNDSIIINSGEAVISSNTLCDDLTINSGAALSVNSGVTLTATTTTLNSTSQSYSSLIVSGTITGEVNYKRHVNTIGTSAGGGNDLISAPVVGQTFGSFATANPNLPASDLLRAFAPYNVTAGAYQNYNTDTNALTVLNPGIGYRAATTDGSTLTFTGTVRTNDVLDVPILAASAGKAWNLIGNPYPSYIDFVPFFDANAAEFESGNFNAIYGYDGDASDGWIVWNLATIADPNINDLIAPGQAFFVKSKTGGGLVDFTTAMRRTGSSDDFIANRQPNSSVASSKLNLNSANNSSSTQIYFIEGTTRGLDVGYDAGSYRGNAAEFSIFSNLVEDNTGLDMAIQSLPYTDLSDVVIPIGVNAQAGVQLSIGIDNVSSLPSGIDIYLEDTVENTFTLLNETAYVFTPTTDLSGTGRFYLRYSSGVLTVLDATLDYLQIYTTVNPKSLIIKGELNAATMVNLYDIRGRLVLNEKINQFNLLNTVDISSLGTGIYIVKVFNDTQSKTKKLIIK